MLGPVIRIVRLEPRCRRHLWAAMALTFLFKVCEVVPDVLLGLMIDAAFRKSHSFLSQAGLARDLSTFYLLSVITVVVWVGSNAFQYWSSLQWKNATRVIQFRLRLDFTRDLMDRRNGPLPEPAELRERNRSINADLDNVEIYFSRTLDELFRILFSCIITGPILFLISREFLFYAVISVLSAFAISVYLQNKIRPRSQAVKKAASEMHVKIDDIIAGAAIANDFGIEARLHEQIHDAAGTLRDANRKVSRLNSAIIPLCRTPIQLGLAGILIHGILLAMNNQISFGFFTAAAFLSRRLLLPLTFLGGLLDSVERGANEVGVVLERLEKLNGQTIPKPRPNLGRPAEALRVVDVTYAYGDRNVLQELNIEFLPGRLNVVRGRTGIGKTTFLRLLKHELPLKTGEVKYGGTRFNDVEFGYGEIAYAPQRPVLFSSTVLDNITLFAPEVDADALARALTISRTDSFVHRLPQGLQTRVGAHGVPLSGGQTQCISLARAIYADAKIILLDEPTAAMDVETERDFLSALKTLRDGRLILVTSHRPQTIDAADFLFELK